MLSAGYAPRNFAQLKGLRGKESYIFFKEKFSFGSNGPIGPVNDESS